MADIIDTTMQAGSFKKFHKALEKAGLLDKFRGPGPFTLFAANDKAWDKIGNDILSLLYDNVANLREVLLYQALPGMLTEDDLAASDELETLNGDTVIVYVDKEGIHINNATIIQPDLIADNGIVHVVDNVVLSKVEAGV